MNEWMNEMNCNELNYLLYYNCINESASASASASASSIMIIIMKYDCIKYVCK